MTIAPPLFRDIGPMEPFFRATDWASTGLGDPSTWSPVLRACVDMIMRMPEPAIIFWGPELIQIYNFGYSHIMGPRHPRFLGGKLRDCWPDTYDTVIPMMRDALVGKVVEINDALIPVTRFGFTEETYFTFSFVPLRNENGEVEGLIQPINETTKAVLLRRRSATVAELSPRMTLELDPIATATSAFAANVNDIPFALIYVTSEEDGAVHYAAGIGIPGDVPGLAAIAHEVAASGQTRVLAELAPYVGDAALGPWPEPVKSAIVMPLQRSAEGPTLGAVVFGTSSRLVFDDAYRSFFESCARALATNLTFQRDQQKRDELDRAKTAFFSNVSHEFRTPLTLMLGPIDDALGDPAHALDREQRQRLELVRRNGDRLFKLVNSLLDFSRIEARRGQAHFVPVDLATFTADLASSFRSLVERSGLKLVVDCPPLGEPVWVDREMWEKIVLNLLSNAFKFTLHGEIGVQVQAVADRVEVRIRDSGVGIPPAEQAKVFERFHRVEGSRGRSYEGSGIGLALVRELVTLHGGTIALASEDQRGTTFTVSLRRGADHLPSDQRANASTALLRHADSAHNAYVREAEGWGERAAAPSSVTVAPADAARVLVADDNADMLEYICRLLGPSYRVEAVTNGAEALAAIERALPDLVVSDVMMPVLDGFGLVAAVRANPRTRSVPIILLSARAGEESRVEGLAAGADDYISKPFPARELLARVAARLEIARIHAEMASRLEELVEQRTAELVEVNRELESFSYSVSHDLRAPLRHILGFSQLLERRSQAALDEVSSRHVKTIIAAAERGGKLVDDLLAFSRMGRAQLKRSRVALGQLVESVRDELAPEQGARQVDWKIDALPEVAADPALLRLVIQNLMANALKYTRGKDIAQIAIGARRLDDEQEIFVADNGVGFDMRYVDKLFGVFQRLHSNEEFEGTGIGLALVRRIVQRHGGRVWAEGTLGAGATFHFTLPAV